jgi:hypothetical protein
MTSTAVVQFPHSRIGAHHRDPPAKRASSRVVRFPNPLDSLTRDDLDALAGLTASASGKWLCETTRDDNWDLSAILVSGRTDSHEYAAFPIRRCDGKLVLIDARLAAHWRTLGIFDDTASLVNAVGRMIG